MLYNNYVDVGLVFYKVFVLERYFNFWEVMINLNNEISYIKFVSKEVLFMFDFIYFKYLLRYLKICFRNLFIYLKMFLRLRC